MSLCVTFSLELVPISAWSPFQRRSLRNSFKDGGESSPGRVRMCGGQRAGSLARPRSNRGGGGGGLPQTLTAAEAASCGNGRVLSPSS